MTSWNVAVPVSFFVPHQKCVHAAPLLGGQIPHNTKVRQGFFQPRIELSGSLVRSLVDQPHAKVFSVFSVALRNVAMPLSFFELYQQLIRAVPLLGGWIPHNTESLQCVFLLGAERPGFLVPPLLGQPRSEVLSVFSVRKRDVAIAGSFLVRAQECVHALPLPTQDVPHDARGLELLYPIGVQIPVLFVVALCVQPHPKLFSAFLVHERNVAISFSFLVPQQERMHGPPLPAQEIPNNPKLGQSVFESRIQCSLFLAESLSGQPMPEIVVVAVGVVSPVFLLVLIVPGNIAITESFFVLHQEPVRVLPLLGVGIPRHPEFR
mmetsp:Transcript_11733/g.24769  ORF Transcript_11733/g.24769 Transcript_11733/m.24769 type:complete len:321 (+) Transcript_11733:461-1423(+)